MHECIGAQHSVGETRFTQSLLDFLMPACHCYWRVLLKGRTGYLYDMPNASFGGNLNDRSLQFDLSWTVGHCKEELTSSCERTAQRFGIGSISRCDLDNRSAFIPKLSKQLLRLSAQCAGGHTKINQTFQKRITYRTCCSNNNYHLLSSPLDEKFVVTARRHRHVIIVLAINPDNGKSIQTRSTQAQ
ncbi:hypothetical protein D3C73_846660 [compost metagenome]